MALEEYLELGGVEIANHARLRAYLQSVGSPLTSGADICACPTLTAEVLDHLPYTTPEEDEAPWYDPDVPESADFAGFMVLSIDGLDEHPVSREVTTAIAGGGALGPGRVQPRTITVTGLLLGASCCAVEYGLHWLAEALTGCTGAGCDGDCLHVFNCCPGSEMTPGEFTARHRRTLRRVALAQGPRPIARTGDGCTSGTCDVGADILTVEFVLTAATPWRWTDPVPVLDVDLPADDGGCITWCLHPPPEPPARLCVDLSPVCPPGSLSVPFGDGACELAWPDRPSVVEPCEAACRLAACPDPRRACADPACLPPAPPVPLPPSTCFCQPIATNRACYDIDLSHRPRWSTDFPMITVRAGERELRNLTLTFYERHTENHAGLTCEEIAAIERCNPHSVYHVGYVPAGGALTLDGQVGRAVVECGGECETSPNVYGRDGNPVAWQPLDCARFCLCLETDALNPPAADAAVIVSVTGRGY